jgi:hypothetical protein
MLQAVVKEVSIVDKRGVDERRRRGVLTHVHPLGLRQGQRLPVRTCLG